jgi:UDP-GlcNAc:undecaprenyl-phosphate GlcNAc-1-phosphate transferase
MHLHHRLLELGHSQRRVALIIYLWVGVLAFSAAASTLFPLSVVAPAFGAGLIVAMLVTMAPRLHRRFAELRTATKAYR